MGTELETHGGRLPGDLRKGLRGITGGQSLGEEVRLPAIHFLSTRDI
jgi:hypothetical protein